jgi:glycosyltransferase involved in cell wall biosynthesis
MRPVASVITAVRNGARHLAETIASVQAQSFEDWEYLIVDDASEDGTREVVERMRQQDRRLILLKRTTSGGPYAAANDAVLQARGEYVFRTDGDDLQPPERFSRQLQFLQENPQFQGCVSYWQAFDSDGLIARSVASVPRPGAFRWYLLLRGASVHSSLCIRRQALLDVGLYRDLPLSQDYRLWCELTRRRWLGVMDEVLSYVRFHEARSTNLRGALQKELALDVLRDHWLAMSGEACPDDLVEALWAVGYSLPFEVSRGLDALQKWARLWRADETLTAEERDELESLTRLRSWKFLRTNLRRTPGVTMLEAARYLVRKPSRRTA